MHDLRDADCGGEQITTAFGRADWKDHGHAVLPRHRTQRDTGHKGPVGLKRSLDQRPRKGEAVERYAVWHSGREDALVLLHVVERDLQIELLRDLGRLGMELRKIAVV